MSKTQSTCDKTKKNKAVEADPLKIAPTAIFGGQNEIGNPHHYDDYSTARFFDEDHHQRFDEDYASILKFLFAYNGSSATFNAYRRELERFVQWAWRVEQRSIIPMNRDDIESFVRFTLEPPIAWIGLKNVARFKKQNGALQPNPQWRPYVISVSKVQARNGVVADKKQYQPSQAAVRSTFAVLSSFYDYLTEEKLIEFNPVSLIRQKSKFIRKDHNQAVVRRITNLQWDYVIETAQMLADEDGAAHERTLFIMNCLFAMYLRISELVADERSTPVMGDFRKDHDQNWWFHVTGKGNKDRTIVVSHEMLEALKRYRRSMGMGALPSINDQHPLIQKSKGFGPIESTRHIRRIVQDCFDRAYERMKKDGLGEDAEDLRAATVHWLRHTGISEDVKIRPREHVRDDAGHATMATTDRYIESDRRERHSSGRKKPIKEL